MPHTSRWPLLLVGWCAVLFISSGVLWLMLRGEGDDVLRPVEFPPKPDPAPTPKPVSQPAQPTPTVPRRSRVALDAEIAQLEKIVSIQKQVDVSQQKQRELLADSIKRYGILIARHDPTAAEELAFFRRKSSELAAKIAEARKAFEETEARRTELRDKLKHAEEKLRTEKQALDSEVGTLETAKAVSTLKYQIATLDCRIGLETDGLAWCNVQQAALLKVLSGTKDAIQLAVELLEKWQAPGRGIAVLESQLNELRAERELISGK